MKQLAVVFTLVAAVALMPSAAAQEPDPALCFASNGPTPASFDFWAQCSVVADCGAFSNVSCSAGGTCVGVDRNCFFGANERGYVTCSGGTTYCAGPCCGSDGVCEYSYGCGCSDPDCASDSRCNCQQNGYCNYAQCGCDDPDCSGTKSCPGDCSQCSSITNCVSNEQCSLDCPGSICTFTGVCLCAG